MNRRNFMMGAATVAGALSRRATASPNETVRIATVGLGGRGMSHVNAFTKMENVELVAICDVDDSHTARYLKALDDKGYKKPATYVDMRKLLEDKSIDAISIATPNHWHTLQTIWACQAGKDVYVEKPCSHNIFETKQIVAAARHHDRIVQMGSQSRSSVALQEAVQKMRDGELGDVYMARALCFKWRDTIGRTPTSAVPTGVDYDLWTGPAPKREFSKNRFHYNWHWFWDTGNGDLGNQGIHEMDIARWGLGVKMPVKVSAIGGHYMFDDDQETPNTLNCAFDFNENGKHQALMFEVRHWMSNHEGGIGEGGRKKDPNTIGNLFYGSKGYMAIDGYDRYKMTMGKDQDPGPAKVAGGDHFANFIEAVRSRKRAELHAEIAEGAASTVLVHLANISYRLGRTLYIDPHTGDVIGDPEAQKMYSRVYRAPFVVTQKV